MKTVVIFGGSGFVGQHVIRRLAKKSYKIIVPYQQTPNLPKLRFLGNFGQIIPLKFNKLDEILINELVKKASFIINLKTLWDEKNDTYEQGIYSFNVELIKIINSNNKFAPYVFFSGLGVADDVQSKRIKYISKVERYIRENIENSVIIKPGIIIGGGDKFINKLVPIMKLSPFIPLFGGGNSKFQPVYIEDVTKGIEVILENLKKGDDVNQIYEFVGNEIFTYKALYSHILKCLSIKRVFFYLPFTIAKIILTIFSKIGIQIITMDQFELFRSDNLPSKKHLNFGDLNILPQDLKEIIKISLNKIS